MALSSTTGLSHSLHNPPTYNTALKLPHGAHAHHRDLPSTLCLSQPFDSSSCQPHNPHTYPHTITRLGHTSFVPTHRPNNTKIKLFIRRPSHTLSSQNPTATRLPSYLSNLSTHHMASYPPHGLPPISQPLQPPFNCLNHYMTLLPITRPPTHLTAPTAPYNCQSNHTALLHTPWSSYLPHVLPPNSLPLQPP